MMSMMWLRILVSVFFSLLFVYIFIQGYEGGGVVEGLRYGIIIGLFFQVVGTLNQYIVYPLPFKLVIQWIIFGLIQFSIAGILSALIYKPKPKKP
jgi:hypothetical protein